MKSSKRIPSRRGFASMSPERQREISSLGGKSVPPEKRSFTKDPNLASKAGRIGGLKSKGTAFAKNRALASEAGRKGGLTRAANRGKVAS